MTDRARAGHCGRRKREPDRAGDGRPVARLDGGFTLADPNAPFEPLLAAWNGRRWRAIPVHLAKGTSGRLDGLAAASADDAWAVGTADVSDDSLQPLFLHWNGREWVRVPEASVPGFGYVSMYGVAIHSATDAWAVGEAESTTKPVLRPVIEHWNGRRWQLMANPPVPSMTAPTSVTVAAYGEAWAVGRPWPTPAAASSCTGPSVPGSRRPRRSPGDPCS